MAVVLDASFLIPLLDENARIDVPDARKKVNYLVAELEKAREVIVVPTPALSEFLSGADEAGPKYLQIIAASARFQVADFDTLAAVEAAAEIVEAKRAGDKKGGVDASWQKIKFDRQIIAIARVTGVTKIYSHDPHFKTLVGLKGPEVVDFSDLPLPPEGAQMAMNFSPEEDSEPAEG